MTTQDQYEKICQRVLRKHYREYSKAVCDPFFVDCESKAKAKLTEMLRNTRSEVETIVAIPRWDLNSRRIAERIIGKYLNIGRKYGERYYKRKLKIN